LQCGIHHFSLKGQGTVPDVNIHGVETVMRSVRKTLVKGRARHRFIDVCLVHSEQLQSKKTYKEESASCTMGTGSFPGVKSGWGMTLTPHPLLLPWS
jgi:hypothetical protein